MAYNTTEERFKLGEADLNSLIFAQNRRESARNNYIQALKDYWDGYYKLRKLTLYDFEMDVPLSFNIIAVSCNVFMTEACFPIPKDYFFTLKTKKK